VVWRGLTGLSEPGYNGEGAQGVAGEPLIGRFIDSLGRCDRCGVEGVLRDIRGCRSCLAQPPANGWDPSGMGVDASKASEERQEGC